jgi:hypothetical protein
MTTELDRHDDAVRRFAEACLTGDTTELLGALDTEAIALCDSGGLAPAAPGLVQGAREVAELVWVLLRRQEDAVLTIEAVNGRAGLALRCDGRAISVISIEEAGRKVSTLWIVLNPAKLGGWHRC